MGRFMEVFMAAITASCATLVKTAIGGAAGAYYFVSNSEFFFDIIRSQGIQISQDARLFHQTVSLLSGLVGGIIAANGIDKLEKPWQKLLAIGACTLGTSLISLRCANLIVEFLAKNPLLTMEATAIYKMSLLYSFTVPAALIVPAMYSK